MPTQTEILQMEQAIIRGQDFTQTVQEQDQQEVVQVQQEVIQEQEEQIIKPKTIRVETLDGTVELTEAEEREAEDLARRVISGETSSVSISGAYATGRFAAISARARYLQSKGESEIGLATRESRINREKGLQTKKIQPTTYKDVRFVSPTPYSKLPEKTRKELAKQRITSQEYDASVYKDTYPELKGLSKKQVMEMQKQNVLVPYVEKKQKEAQQQQVDIPSMTSSTFKWYEHPYKAAGAKLAKVKYDYEMQKEQEKRNYPIFVATPEDIEIDLAKKVRPTDIPLRQTIGGDEYTIPQGDLMNIKLPVFVDKTIDMTKQVGKEIYKDVSSEITKQAKMTLELGKVTYPVVKDITKRVGKDISSEISKELKMATDVGKVAYQKIKPAVKKVGKQFYGDISAELSKQAKMTLELGKVTYPVVKDITKKVGKQIYKGYEEIYGVGKPVVKKVGKQIYKGYGEIYDISKPVGKQIYKGYEEIYGVSKPVVKKVGKQIGKGYEEIYGVSKPIGKKIWASEKASFAQDVKLLKEMKKIISLEDIEKQKLITGAELRGLTTEEYSKVLQETPWYEKQLPVTVLPYAVPIVREVLIGIDAAKSAKKLTSKEGWQEFKEEPLKSKAADLLPLLLVGGAGAYKGFKYAGEELPLARIKVKQSIKSKDFLTDITKINEEEFRLLGVSKLNIQQGVKSSLSKDLVTEFTGYGKRFDIFKGNVVGKKWYDAFNKINRVDSKLQTSGILISQPTRRTIPPKAITFKPKLTEYEYVEKARAGLASRVNRKVESLNMEGLTVKPTKLGKAYQIDTSLVPMHVKISKAGDYKITDFKTVDLPLFGGESISPQLLRTTLKDVGGGITKQVNPKASSFSGFGSSVAKGDKDFAMGGFVTAQSKTYSVRAPDIAKVRKALLDIDMTASGFIKYKNLNQERLLTFGKDKYPSIVGKLKIQKPITYVRKKDLITFEKYKPGKTDYSDWANKIIQQDKKINNQWLFNQKTTKQLIDKEAKRISEYPTAVGGGGKGRSIYANKGKLTMEDITGTTEGLPGISNVVPTKIPRPVSISKSVLVGGFLPKYSMKSLLGTTAGVSSYTGLREQQISKNLQTPKSIQTPLNIQSPMNIQLTGTTQVPMSAQVPKSVQVPMLINLTKQTTPSPYTPGTPTPTTTTTPPGKITGFPWLFGKLDRGTKVKGDNTPYDVYVGKQKIADNIRGKKRALNFGAYAVDNSLAARFRIVKDTKGKPKEQKIIAPANYFKLNRDKFRNYQIRKGKKVKLKNRWIENRGRRLDTTGEINRIEVAKFLGKQRRQSVNNINIFGTTKGVSSRGSKKKVKKQKKGVNITGIIKGLFR